MAISRSPSPGPSLPGSVRLARVGGKGGGIRPRLPTTPQVVQPSMAEEAPDSTLWRAWGEGP